MKHTRRRRVIALIVFVLSGLFILLGNEDNYQQQAPPPSDVASQSSSNVQPSGAASIALAKLEVKGRAPKTDYSRAQFGDGWSRTGSCDTRNIILNRDLTSVVSDDKCRVLSGVLQDPYSGVEILFERGPSTSALVQIDHVVALSDAWQKGAQQLTREQRIALANDPLELLAVDGNANQVKSAGDAATWLPANKAFRCQYVARQIAVKLKHKLWVVPAEKTAMEKMLAKCPGQTLPSSQPQ